MVISKSNSAAVVMTAWLLGACAYPTQQGQAQAETAVMPVSERTELVVLRQPAGYSDVALIGIEEGTYIWKPQEISPFGIQLSFGNSDGGSKHLHTVYFATDSATISKKEKQRLEAIVASLPESGVILSGYADPRASGSYNLELSRRRADTVASYLRYHGISVDKECAYGKYRLPDANLCQ